MSLNQLSSKKLKSPFLSRYPSVCPVLIFRYDAFSEAIFILHYYFSLFVFIFINVSFRLQKGHCTSGIMNIFLVWLRRILIKFCQLCLVVYTKSPKNTGISKCLLCWLCYSWGGFSFNILVIWSLNSYMRPVHIWNLVNISFILFCT